MSAITLPPLGDLSGYIDPDNPIRVHNPARVSVKDKLIQCSGVILSVRSTVFKEMLANDNEIFLTEFEENVESVYQCLKLLYGGSVLLTEGNVFVIYKFGFIYKIESLQSLVLDWLLDNVPIVSFWDLFNRFRRYQSEISLNVFNTIANKHLENTRLEFVKATVTALITCNEYQDQKCITQFMLNTTWNTLHLEASFNLFKTFFAHEYDNGNADVAAGTKEQIAEVFLDCIDSKLDAIAKRHFDRQILYDIFESLHDIMSTKTNYKKLSSLILKVVSRLPPNSGTSNVDESINGEPAASSQDQQPSTSATHSATSTSATLSATSTTLSATSNTPSARATGPLSTSTITGPLAKARTRRLVKAKRHLAKPTTPSATFATTLATSSATYNAPSATFATPSAKATRPLSVRSQHWRCNLTKDLISSLTVISMSSTDKLLRFFDNNDLPPYIAVEIALEWIKCHPYCHLKTVEKLLGKATDLPKDYCRDTMKSTFHDLFRSDDFARISDLVDSNQSGYYYTKCALTSVTATTSSDMLRSLLNRDELTIKLPCERTGCNCIGYQTGKFHYNDNMLPTYDYTPVGGCIDNNTIVHCTLMYTLKCGYPRFNTSPSDLQDKSYFFSFVTERNYLTDCATLIDKIWLGVLIERNE